MLHPHTQKFGVRVSGARDAAPCGPQDEFSERMARKVGGKYPAIGGGDGTVAVTQQVQAGTLQEKREKRANIWEQMKNLLDVAEAEKRELSGEETSQYDQLEAELDTLGKEIQRRERHENRARELDRVDRDPAIVNDPTDDSPTSEEYEVAFRGFMRDGISGVSPEQRKVLQQGFVELRAQGVASGAAGGYLVPQGFRQRLQETMKFFSQMRQVAEVIETDTGNPLPWPTNNDTANKGAILAENTQVTEQDVTIGTKTLGAFMYTSKLVRVSFQLLQDSGFDLEGWLARKLGERIGRIQNEHFTTGVGTTQPEGVQTNATVGVTGTTGQTTTVIFEDLIDLVHSVDVAYRAEAGFMLNDLTVAKARKLKDSTGHPLWQPSLQLGTPDTLLGYGLFTNNDMPVMAADAKSILFGDFKRGYVIRDVSGVQLLRLEERYADYLQVGFLAFQRSDGLPQDAAAIRAYKNSAT
jgi:HK97 family phage major capsid protein